MKTEVGAVEGALIEAGEEPGVTLVERSHKRGWTVAVNLPALEVRQRPVTSWLRSMTPPPGPAVIARLVTAATATGPVLGSTLLIWTSPPLMSTAIESAALLPTLNVPPLKVAVILGVMRFSRNSMPGRYQQIAGRPSRTMRRLSRAAWL